MTRNCKRKGITEEGDIKNIAGKKMREQEFRLEATVRNFDS